MAVQDRYVEGRGGEGGRGKGGRGRGGGTKRQEKIKLHKKRILHEYGYIVWNSTIMFGETPVFLLNLSPKCLKTILILYISFSTNCFIISMVDIKRDPF